LSQRSDAILLSERDAALSLLDAAAVRSRADRMLELGLADRLPHFRVRQDKLGATADLVIAVTRAAYPSLDVPFHSRWRHFVFQGEDRWRTLSAAAPWKDKAARARAAFDLGVVSVLVDAGAGTQWRYHDARTGAQVGRSEGLALASLAMFAAGAFSADPADPLRVDAEALLRVTERSLTEGFQVTADNPLPGLAGRAALLRRLGEVVAAAPAVFASRARPRPGGLFDRLAALDHGSGIAAAAILSEVLRGFGPIWPSRLTLGGIPLGDCWRHPSLVIGDATDHLVPLHKLSQWMTYSLIEPLREAGVAVTDIDGLTGLAEYRNGGLFVDTGVLELRDAAAAGESHEAGSALVVEWRALTVALLDRLAASVRQRLDLDAVSFPLACLLEGGTWAAGRAIARERRADGAPPIRVASDGTVF
jgi:Protein of unknown function (DUF1688)